MKLLKLILGVLLILGGVGLMVFATVLFLQLQDWTMKTFTVGLFALGSMPVFGGIEIIRGGSIRVFLRDLIDAVVHSR